MSEPKDYRTDLDMWIDMWDEEQRISANEEPEKITPSPFGGVSSARAQDVYYDVLDTPELLQEDKTMNPVYPDSAGPDCNTTKPVWVSEDLLREVERLKHRLFAVENRMAELGGGKKWPTRAVTQKEHGDDGKNGRKLMSEVESLRRRLERVSSQLGIKDEPSPWVAKRPKS